MKKRYKDFGYYFLNKRLHPQIPKGYRVSIALLIINKNNSGNRNKILLIKESNNSWGLPKKGVESGLLIEDLYTTVARNIENELGYKGIKVVETRPAFRQIALFFDYDRQIYDTTRSLYESRRGRPDKGKVYLLAIMEYNGPDEIPLFRGKNAEVIDYAWVTKESGQSLINKNFELVQKGLLPSRTAAEFGLKLFQKVINTLSSVQQILNFDNDQENLFKLQ